MLSAKRGHLAALSRQFSLHIPRSPPTDHSCFCRSAASSPRVLSPRAVVTAASTTSTGRVCSRRRCAERSSAAEARLANARTQQQSGAQAAASPACLHEVELDPEEQVEGQDGQKAQVEARGGEEASAAGKALEHQREQAGRRGGTRR